jgi:hypothetical protein
MKLLHADLTPAHAWFHAWFLIWIAIACVGCQDVYSPSSPDEETRPMATVGPIVFDSSLAIRTVPFRAEVIASSDVERVAYAMDGQVIGNVAEGATFPYDVDGLSPGTYQLHATAYNASGFKLGMASQALHILPSAAMEIHLPEQTAPGLFILRTHVAGPIVRVVYYLDGEPLGHNAALNNSFSMTVPISHAGTHTVSVKGFDANNYPLASASKTFHLLDSPDGSITPPVQQDSFEFLTPVGLSTSPLTFSVNAPPGTLRVDYWTQNNLHLGTSFDAGSHFPVFSTECEPGAWPITARAVDGQGTLIAETTRWVTIVENAVDAPMAPPESDRAAKGLEEAPNTQIAFISPASDTLVQGTQTTLQVSTTTPVASVQYTTSNSPMGVSHQPADSFTVPFTFWLVGPRLIEARAYNEKMELVAMTQKSVTIVPAPADAPPGNEPEPEKEQDAADDDNPPPKGPVPTCMPGELVDCNNACAHASWINDGLCDDGKNVPSNFLCPALGMDGSDCGQQAQSPCTDGKILDCVGHCAKAAWINDGFCDDGSQYAIDFTCPELGNDGTDCNAADAPSPAPEPPAGNVTGVDVPYFYQYANSLSPGSSCQNTSIAMVLKHYGWKGTPDTITSAWGKNVAQSPAGLAQVFNSYAKSSGLSQSLVPHTNGTIGGLKALLAAGKPVIVHGYFTGFGHVVVATGYANGTYYVNDPAGKWNQTFKGGYPYGIGGQVGKGIAYGAAAFEQAVATLNGSGFEPLWYHEVVP